MQDTEIVCGNRFSTQTNWRFGYFNHKKHLRYIWWS